MIRTLFRLLSLTLCLALLSHSQLAHAQRRAPAAQVCIPGAQLSCACPNGESGVQQCNDRGTGLRACACGSVTAAATLTPPPTPRAQLHVRHPAPRVGLAASPLASTRSWYGWQILIIDGAAIALGSAGAAAGGSAAIAFSSLAGTASFAGGPIVHWAHGHLGRGFASMFGLRLGLPVGGAILGALVGGAAGGFRQVPTFVGAAIGASVGAITGIVLDVAWLAYDDPSDHQLARSHTFVLPYASVDPSRQLITAGLFGAF
ncbi:MAG: hypothetical protein Q8Q09_24600 [Deltaproteobacteria bacterium]|nr:hypothetical protein [Deltaproteobacteria bacterium]